MRAHCLACLLVFASCGKPPATEEPPAEPAWTLDGFLRLLPEDLSVTVRLPSPALTQAKSYAVNALLQAFGRAGELETHKGVDAGRSPGLALTTKGGWVHYLPAADKAELNRQLKEEAHKFAYREEANWVLLSVGSVGADKVSGEPLPPGDMAVRVRFHPLLDAFFQSGDILELGLTLGGVGCDMSGRLRASAKSATAKRLAAAAPADADLIQYLPPSLALRVETTFPATSLAAFLKRAVAVHTGVAAEKDRVLLERLFRELLTAVDPAKGMGLGIELRHGSLSAVLFGKIAAGPPSPLLAGIRSRGRSTIGPLVLDLRADAPRPILGHYAWIVDAEPQLDGLPETAWGVVADLCAGEEGGLPIAYTDDSGWFVCGLGKRADILVHGVRRRLKEGAQDSLGARTLRQARERRKDSDYVLGVILNGHGLAGLAQNDTQALLQLLGAGPTANAAGALAIAGFRIDGELWLEGRALY